MSQPVYDLNTLLATMSPELQPGVYIYASVPFGTDLSGIEPIAIFREREGLTIIAEESEALKAGIKPMFRAAWITLTVHSDLQAVGLTAAFAAALGKANVSCNVVAAAYHDHVFVPIESADKAMAALQQLQREGLRES
ncbi:acetyltransferase [Burkholderia sp. Leaf177]|uniref:ACT domain-containing protein n=1 Tax=Burkholderia sp. Leaf177 TaxID=1736287 RepID=UPI0006F95C6D|nr:ACT domain-containing protein [Burkholderia sp. Leaf177]KQR74394.1 acetyltransferase [Burkholderia sp. Leaf177]